MRYLLFVFLLATQITYAQAQETRQIGPFTGLVVSGKLEVYLEHGETDQIIIESTDYPEGELNISLKGSTLKLSLVDGWIKGDRRLRLRVQYRNLDEIRVLAGAALSSREILTADRLELKAGSGAEVDLQLEVHTLEAAATEGANVELSGTVKNQYATANTGGEYDASRLSSDRTDVKSNTGGLARVVANEHLDAVANTGGRIQYSGDPQEKYTRSNLAGEIRGF
ncbi:MAG: head GIN domain-containing protein [Lewinella sp.]|jgi:hypothetical protein|uniref:head GIN domain-containing protein n=1 Tax=Lewinella sp. TaxID=2004506 RepID=UPI003D6A34A5